MDCPSLCFAKESGVLIGRPCRLAIRAGGGGGWGGGTSQMYPWFGKKKGGKEGGYLEGFRQVYWLFFWAG